MKANRNRFEFILKPENELGRKSPREIRVSEFTTGELPELLIGIAIPMDSPDARIPLSVGVLSAHLNRDEVRRLRDKLDQFLGLEAITH